MSAALGVRPERLADAAQVRRVHEVAFGRPAEAALVDALRARDRLVCALVAVESDRIVGHIVFTPVTIAGARGASAVGLGPMAVLPERQRRGIGSRLVEAGLSACREAGQEAAVVLGHPRYYPCFGFRPATVFGLECKWDAPEAFMAIELRPGALRAARGRVDYVPEFDDV